MATRLFRFYGEGRLIRPGVEVQKRLLANSKHYVLARFPLGKRREKEEVCGVLKCYFEFFSLQLDSLLRKLASREFMEFVLYQYDMAAAEWQQTPDEVTIEACRVGSEFSVIRRGLKYLAERTAMRSSLPEFSPVGKPHLFEYVEEALFASRMLAELYLACDKAYYILPGEMELALERDDMLIDGVPWPLPFSLVPDVVYEHVDVAYSARVAKDRANRTKYFPTNSMNFDFQRQAEVLDPAFEKSFGYPFSRFLGVIAVINENFKPAPGSYPVMFFRKKGLVQDIMGNFGISKVELAERILAGFTITRQQMLEEQRAIFQPKQEHRAFRRGYIEFPHTTGPHLFWCGALASEGLDHLVNGVCFKKLPDEWLTPETSAGLERLSNEAGCWFEREVAAKLRSLGIQGDGRHGRIIGGGETLDIPAEVGQLDFLGYSDRDSALVVAESKMVEVGFESRYFRDEISQFASNKRSYAAQLRKKWEWVAANRGILSRALGATNDKPKVFAVLITLYPTYAAFKISDLPCVSLVEFMEDHKAKGSWPYDIGIR
jgi:hypothetical protein